MSRKKISIILISILLPLMIFTGLGAWVVMTQKSITPEYDTNSTSILFEAFDGQSVLFDHKRNKTNPDGYQYPVLPKEYEELIDMSKVTFRYRKVDSGTKYNNFTADYAIPAGNYELLIHYTDTTVGYVDTVVRYEIRPRILEVDEIEMDYTGAVWNDLKVSLASEIHISYTDDEGNVTPDYLDTSYLDLNSTLVGIDNDCYYYGTAAYKIFENSVTKSTSLKVVGSTYYLAFKWSSITNPPTPRDTPEAIEKYDIKTALTNNSYIINSKGFKYKSVALLSNKSATTVSQTDKSKLYTIEEALQIATSNQMIFTYNTSFAGPTIAAALGYPKDYKVTGTLLVPFGESTKGLTTDGKAATEKNSLTLYYVNDGQRTSLTESGVNLAATKVAGSITASPSRTAGFTEFTLTSGVNITVESKGVITVNAVMNMADGATMYVNGVNYGEMILNSGSTITFKDGSTFNSMGFTRGDGHITVQSGASVYEPLNASGFKGHTATQGADDVVFAIQQFTISSIVCSTTIESGANYYAQSFIKISFSFAGINYNITYGATAYMAGLKPSDAKTDPPLIQFDSDNASLTKSIDETNGKVTLILSGNISLHNMDLAEIDPGVGGVSFKIKTTGVQIPFAGHFKFDVAGNLTIPSNVGVKLLPGAEMHVLNGGTVNVEGTLFSYGESNYSFEDSKYTQFKDGNKAYPISSTATCYRKAPTLGYTATTPAKVIVDGTLKSASNANLCAEISSTGGGELEISSKTAIKYRLAEDDATGSTPNPYYVNLTCRALHGNGKTSPMASGTWKYLYEGEAGQWVGYYYEIIYHVFGDDENGNYAYLTGNESDLYVPGLVSDSLIRSVTPDPTREYHVFTGWYYDKECTQLVGSDGRRLSNGDVLEVFAGWEAIEYTIEFVPTYAGTVNDDDIDLPPETITWSYGTITDLPNPTWDEEKLADLEFSGWKSDSGHLSETLTIIYNENIKTLEIGGNKIYVYGLFKFDGEVIVMFNINEPQNGEPYKFSPIDNVSRLVGSPLDVGLDSISKPLKAIDSNAVEYYFKGWTLKVSNPDVDGGYEYIFVKDSDVIQQSWLNNEGNLVLEGYWEQKASLAVVLYSNNNIYATLDLTIDGIKLSQLKSNGKGSYSTWQYYYPEGTAVSFDCKGSRGSSDPVWNGDLSYAVDVKITKGKAEPGSTGTQVTGSFKMPNPSVGTFTSQGVTGNVLLSMSTQGCFVEGTNILMADGTQKKVEELKSGDLVQAFNHQTGEYEIMPLWLNLHTNEYTELCSVINLIFADDTELRIVWRHGLFDITLNRYVFIDETNINDYIGHKFSTAIMENNMITSGEVELVSAFITEEYVRYYSPISIGHMNVVAEGLLTVTPLNRLDEGLFNVFEYGEGMKYDEAKMQEDIEKYGLYSYDDFKDLIPYEAFVAAPWNYLKVAMGKGYITWDDILWNIDFLFSGSYV